jgi:hypothetical protein
MSRPDLRGGDRHTTPRRRLSLAPEELATQDAAAARAGVSWSEWIRRVAMEAAFREI